MLVCVTAWSYMLRHEVAGRNAKRKESLKPLLNRWLKIKKKKKEVAKVPHLPGKMHFPWPAKQHACVLSDPQGNTIFIAKKTDR